MAGGKGNRSVMRFARPATTTEGMPALGGIHTVPLPFLFVRIRHGWGAGPDRTDGNLWQSEIRRFFGCGWARAGSAGGWAGAGRQPPTCSSRPVAPTATVICRGTTVAFCSASLARIVWAPNRQPDADAAEPRWRPRASRRGDVNGAGRFGSISRRSSPWRAMMGTFGPPSYA